MRLSRRWMLGFFCCLGLLVGCGSSSVPEDSGPDAGSPDSGTDCPGRQCEVQVLAKDLQNPGMVVVAGGHLYWSSIQAEQVGRVPLSGGSVETVATVDELNDTLTADSTHVYWSARVGSQNGIWRAPLAGGAPQLVQPLSLTLANSVRAFGSHAYWTEGGLISRVPSQGGTPEVLVRNTSVSGFAVDAQGLFYFASSDLYQLTPGGTPVRLAQFPATYLSGTAVTDASAVYLAAWTFPPNGTSCESSRVMRLPKTGEPPQALAEFPDTCLLAIALDDTHVYTTGINRTSSTVLRIMRVPKQGGTPELVVEGTGVFAYYFAVDATHVYWSDPLNGRLLRIPKP